MSEGRRGFTIVELLIAGVLVLVVYAAAWFAFIHGYGMVRRGNEKMDRMQTIILSLERLRSELKELPDADWIERDCLSPGKHRAFAYRTIDERGDTLPVTLTFDESRRAICHGLGESKRVFGEGRILDFTLTHNLCDPSRRLPRWIRIDLKVIDEGSRETSLHAVVCPRLINANGGRTGMPGKWRR